MNHLTLALRDSWWTTRTTEDLHKLIRAEEERATRMLGSAAEEEALRHLDRARAELYRRGQDFSDVLRRMSMAPLGGEEEMRDNLVAWGVSETDMAFARIGMEICAQPFNRDDYLNQPRGQVFGIGDMSMNKKYRWRCCGNMYSGTCE